MSHLFLLVFNWQTIGTKIIYISHLLLLVYSIGRLLEVYLLRLPQMSSTVRTFVLLAIYIDRANVFHRSASVSLSSSITHSHSDDIHTHFIIVFFYFIHSFLYQILFSLLSFVFFYTFLHSFLIPAVYYTSCSWSTSPQS